MADSDINLETHFPDGSPRPQRLTADTTYEEFLEWFNGSSLQGAMESYYSYRPTEMNALSQNSPGYERNEAGRYVNEAGEELFYYTGPDYEDEKRNGAGLNADADYVTMDEIRARYEEDTVLHKHFDSVDQYVSYITDRQDLIDSGQIMDKWERSNQLWHDTFIRRRDGRGGPNGQYIADITEAERRRVEDAERAAEAGLVEQYGIQTSIIDDNGNQLRWNGTGYSLIKRYKEDDKWGRTIAGAGAGLIVGGALAPYLGALTGAAPSGFVGPLSTSQIVGGKVAAGLAAGAGSAASQGLLTGSIDPKSVLSTALITGLNPGGYVADNWVPGIDNRIGSATEGDWVLGGTGQGFSNGLVSGTVNDVVSQGITTGSVDLEDALIAGATQGTKQSLMDVLYDMDYYSQDKIAARMMMADPSLTEEQAMALALNDSNYLRTNVGAIIGEGGLLPFIPELSLGGVANAYEGFDSAIGGWLPDIFRPDSPYSGYSSEEIAARREDLSAEWWDANQGNSDYFTESGAMTPAGVRAQYDYVKANFDPNWAYFHGTTGLDEKYSWSPNDRGDTEIYGTAVQATDAYGNPIYTSGTAYEQNYWYDADGNIVTNKYGNPAGGYTSVTSPQDVDFSGGNDLIMYLNNGVLPSTSSTPGFWDAVAIGVRDGWAVYNNGDDGNTAITDSAGNTVLVTTNQFNENITGGGSDKSGNLVNTGDTATNTGGDVTTNTGGDIATNNGGDVATNTGGDVTNNTGDTATNAGGDTATNAGGDVANNAGGDVANNAGNNADSGVDSGSDDGGNSNSELDTTGQYGYYTALDGSQHPYTESGSVQLPSGVTIGEGAVNGALGLTDLVGTGTSETTPSTDQTPGTDILPNSNLLNALKNNGLPPVWTELFGYTKISPYQKARLKVLDGMLSGMQGGGVGNMNALNFGANKDPYQKIGRSLIDAGMEPKG